MQRELMDDILVCTMCAKLLEGIEYLWLPKFKATKNDLFTCVGCHHHPHCNTLWVPCLLSICFQEQCSM